jgi:hypothetical protein
MNLILQKISKFRLLFVLLLMQQLLLAQVPQKMSYQAVIRNSSNALVTSTQVKMRISILQGSPTGTSVYSEIQNPTTNANGLVSLEIGSGTIVTGTFAAINWGTGNYYIKTETDPTGGSNYSIVGASQLLSVPYALYSANGPQGPAGTFPVGTNVGDMQYWNGTSWVMIPIGQPGQTLKVTPTNIPQWSQSTLSTVTTDSVIDVLALQATFTGTVSNAGTELVLSRGFCYATTPNPTVSNTLITSGSGLGVFTESPYDLLPSTLYHVRAFSTTIAGTTYGTDLTFTTLSGIAVLTTTPATDIVGCQATSGGTISTDGGAAITRSGVCFGTSPNPTILDNLVDGDGGIPFLATLSITNPNTLFYYRAFGTNGVNTFYGNQLSFTSENITTTVTTQAATLIKTCSATLNGTVTTSNPAAIQNQGIIYSTNPNPTISVNTYGQLNSETSGLLPNTLYYARAFATTCAQTTYGNEISFTTKANAINVTTNAITGITSCRATFNGTTTTGLGSEVTLSGFCYSLTANPTLETASVIGGSTTNFNVFTNNLICLNPATTYYVRAYSQNCTGITYGNEVSFTTLPTSISIITNVQTFVGSCQIIVPLNTISSTVSTACISRTGICYSSTQNPTINNLFVFQYNGNASISFSENITPSTTYYYRAFVTLCNETTLYGNQLSFTTPPNITSLTTNAVTNITSGTAQLNGVIISNNADYVYSGFVYGTSLNPTLETNYYNQTQGAVTMDTTIQNLSANTTYYVRTYTYGSCFSKIYGNQVSFTTTAVTPHVVGQNFDGGIIIWLNAAGTSGLIAATTDQGFALWGCEGTNIAGTNTSQGSGQANTNAIVSGCSTVATAAKICNDLVLNGKSDWYLPSEAELILIGNLNYFPAGNYWSSSQLNPTQAKFVNGITAGISNKSETNFKVRAIRSF